MNINGPIVFFDSGVGGLTVLHLAMKSMPNESFLYYADSKNVPYGNKTPAEIKLFVVDALKHITPYLPKALVVACNTATSIAIEELREMCDFPVVGMEPAIKPAIESTASGQVVLLATEITLNQPKLENLINDLCADDVVINIAMNKLVDFAENFDFESKELRDYLAYKLAPVPWGEISHVVFGCTHFIYYRNLIQSMLPGHINIIDGNEGTIQQLMRVIERRTKAPEKALTCLLSGYEIDNELIFPYLWRLKSGYR